MNVESVFDANSMHVLLFARSFCRGATGTFEAIGIWCAGNEPHLSSFGPVVSLTLLQVDVLTSKVLRRTVSGHGIDLSVHKVYSGGNYRHLMEFLDEATGTTRYTKR